MRSLTPPTLVTLALLTLGGCASRTPLPPTVADVETAIQQGDYALAWRLAHDPDLAEDTSLQPVLQQLRNEQTLAERDSLRRAQQQAGQGQWHAALATLDASLAQWPQSERLHQARQELDQQQITALVSLRTEVYASEAAWLQNQQSLQRRLAQFGDPSAQALAAELKQRRDTALEELVTLGEWHAAHEQWRQARTALRAATSLDDQYRTHPALVRAEQHMANVNQRARDSRSETLREEARQRLARYRSSQSVEDLVTARRYIHEHRSRGHLEAESETVERLCRERVSRDVATGDALYARGEYQDAYRIWRDIAPLAPNDIELEKKLTRTRRVLESLEELKASSP